MLIILKILNLEVLRIFRDISNYAFQRYVTNQEEP